jgi:hypothetical protein
VSWLQIAGASPGNFWLHVRGPGLIAIYFSCFFGFAVFISLLLHTLLAFEADVRWLAFLGTLLSFIFIFALSLSGAGLTKGNVYTSETTSLAALIMILSLIAACGRTGPQWLILQLIVFLALVIPLGAGNATFRTGGGEIIALLGPAWQQALYYVMYSLGGIIRFCALVECKNNRALTIRDEICYWILILINMGMYFVVFAAKGIFLTMTLTSIDDVQLILQMSLLVQYALTPLLLVHFEALSHANARQLMQQVERANKRLAVAQSAAQARREFIRYVFHEVSGSPRPTHLYNYHPHNPPAGSRTL